MTRGQRRAHWVMWLVLGPIAVAVLVVALASKPARPVQPPVELKSESPR